MTSGLIVNPRSGKGSGKGVALAEKLTGQDDVQVVVLDQFEDLVPALDRMASDGISALFISSGDGTIQQIQTEIAERKRFASFPDLCLLPHGTTNMTGADLGFGMKDLDEQAQFIADAAGRASRSIKKARATVRVANPADGNVRHGMFVGTGAVWRGTDYCQKAVHQTGLRGDWATFATLAAAVAKAVISGSKSTDPDRIAKAYDMKVTSYAGTVVEGGQLLFLATTLNKLILGSRPFWGGKSNSVRASIFPYPQPNVARWLWTSMYGAEDRSMPAGCHSFSSDLITIETKCPFVIDGEFFDPPADEPLRIEKGDDFTYLCAS